MKLILTRHGETEENKKGILQGHLPGTLSTDGIKQAEKLAERLKDEKIDVIFSSDLKRAVDTAKIIAKYYPEVEVVYTKELREGDASSFVGLQSTEVDWNDRPADAETREQMHQRISSLLEKVRQAHKDRNVLFVGHSGINRSLIGFIMGHPVDGSIKIEAQKNTAVNVFEIKEDGNHEVCLINCTKHLE